MLLHSFVCESIACYSGFTDNPRLRLLTLLHDAHEAVTADIPTTWKPMVMKKTQRDLDARLFSSLGVEFTKEEQEVMRIIDRYAFLAECVVVGPPGITEMYPGARPYDIDVVRKWAEVSMEETANGPKSVYVNVFESLTRSLLHKIQDTERKPKATEDFPQKVV